MDHRTPPPSLRTVLTALRAQLVCDRLSDEDGRRLVAVLESIVREMQRMETRPN